MLKNSKKNYFQLSERVKLPRIVSKSARDAGVVFKFVPSLLDALG